MMMVVMVMVKGWVMVVVKVIMVMMVNGCSDGLGKLFQKFIVIFSDFLVVVVILNYLYRKYYIY